MLDREFLLGFIKIHILYHASKEPIFGVEIAEELARHGYSISPGTLYSMLHRLEKEGYLGSCSKVVNGKMRKYYQATAEGRLVLEQSRKNIRELVTEVIEERRGTAYGLYHGVIGITLLPAGLLAGWLWQTFSPAAPFYLGAGLAFLAMLGMMALVRE